MKRYKNFSKNSGVIAYETGKEHIRVQFRDGSVYDYTYESTGKKHIRQMQKLAEEGRGLTTYINTHVRERYAVKIV